MENNYKDHTMRNSILACILFAMLGCGEKKQTKTNPGADSLKTVQSAKPADSLKTVQTKKPADKIYIKDESRYSKVFVNELRSSNYADPIKLIDNYMIVGADTVKFPGDLKLGKKYTFKASKEDQSYLLNLNRINESALKFDFKLYQKDSLIYNEQGEANLAALFFLAEEVDEDDQSGDSYSAIEYAKRTKDCWFTIRMGIGTDDNNRLRAIIKQGCESKSKPALIGNNITLRTENK
jgi:hypothetical protein